MKKLFTLAMLAVAAITANAQNQLVEGEFNVGDKVTIDGKEWLVGKNMITNASFDEDPAKNGGNIVGWTNGTYAQMTTSTFLWHPTGGHDGGAYIQSNKHTGAAGDGSVGQRWTLEPNSYYYFSFWLSNNSANNQYIPVISLTANESTSGGKNERTDVEDDGPTSLNSGCLIGKNGETSAECLGYGNFIDENGDGYGEWAQTGMVFESEEYTYLQFNARWLKENKIQAAFDDFHLHKLYDPETTTPEEIALIALSASVEDFDNYISNTLTEYPAFQEEASDWFFEAAYEDYDDSMPLLDIQNAIKDLEAKKTAIDAAIANADAFGKLMTEAEKVLADTESNPYPGLDEFLSAYEAMSEYQANGFYSDNDDIPASEFILQQIEALKKAINDYRTSQPADADHPADYTYFIQNPEFVNPDAAPTYDENGTPTYPNGDSYTAGSAPADGTSAGWYSGEGGGDQRLNFAQGRACWNAWRSGAVAPISISQDLTGLPNGVYSVSAYMITQANYITDQHIFANGTIQSGVSPTLSKDTWADTNDGEWDFLTTSKVIVSDGKLTIGAMGNLNGNAAAGWFCVTHFVLNYYGEATEEDVINLYNSRISDFTAYADGMGFKADQKTFQEAVAANSGLTDYNEVQTALASLNEAYATAEASQKEYDGVINGTYAAIKDSIANTYPEGTKAVAQAIIDLEDAFLASDTASYTASGAKTTILRQYRDNLLPVIAQCESNSYSNAEAQAYMQNLITSVISELSAITEFPTTETINAYIQKLKDALNRCNAAETFGNLTDGMDMTALIVNPTINSSNNNAAPEGWQVDMKGSGNGLYTNAGQEYDGGSGAYLDAWNGTAGALLYTAKQTIEVPNGQYEVKVMTRTSGDGYYVFTTPDNDSTATKFQHVTKEQYILKQYEDAASDSIATVTDTHGSIWEAAVNELAKFYNIDGPIVDGVGNPYSVVEQIREQTEDDVNNVPDELKQAFNIAVANEGLGRGWHYYTIPVEVKDHILTIGVSTDSTFTAGYQDVEGADCVPFTGTWISADNWTLTLVKEGDNEGWSFVATGINEVASEQKNAITVKGIFNIAGQQLATPQPGINIIGGKKVFIK